MRSSTGVTIVSTAIAFAGVSIGRTSATTASGTAATQTPSDDHESAVRSDAAWPPASLAARRRPSVGTSSKSETPSRKYAGNAGMRKRKKLPEETVERTVVPLTTRKTPNHVASRAASGGERRATANVPAIGAHSSRRALQKYSRRLSTFSWRWAQSRST